MGRLISSLIAVASTLTGGRKFSIIERSRSYENTRFELTILRPGTLWIDDVRIEETGSP